MSNLKRAFKLNNQIKNPKLIWLALLTGVFSSCYAQIAIAEGSRQLIIGGGARPASEWRPNDVLGGIPRTTILQVFAQQGEVINLGSSAIGVSRNGNVGNAVIKNVANTTTFRDCRVDQPLNGFISSNTQETLGPSTVAAGGYTPCTYTVPSTGIYRVEFHGPDGPNPAAGNGQINLLRPIVGNNNISSPDYFPNNFNDQQGSRVALWDVTVTDTTGTIARSGRLFTNYLSLITGGNGPSALVNSNLYIVTKDGYQYNVQTNNLDPNGFVFFSNNRGFVNSNTNQALYRSINLNGPDNNLTLPAGVQLQQPDDPDTATDATNKIFFNQPDPLALTALGITNNPQVPQPATGFQFRGQEGTVGQAGTNPLQGSFEFNNPNTISVSYKIVIDTNGNTLYTDPEDRVLIGTAANGPNQVTWDGKDENGVSVPSGNFTYGATITLNAGEVHFPLLDPENQDGLIITRQQPNITPPNTNIVYYDDRGVKNTDGSVTNPLQGTPPNPLYNILGGLNSALGNVHRFGDGTLTGFGDRKGIDTWTFLPSSFVPNPNIVTIKQADLAIGKTLVTSTPVAGGSVTYNIKVVNAGPSSLNTVGNSQDIDALVKDVFPSQININTINWTCTPETGAPANTICRTASGTGTQLQTGVGVNLPANPSCLINPADPKGGVNLQNAGCKGVIFQVTGTLDANVAAGTTINNTASVLRPKDVTDPNYFNGLGTNNNQNSVSFTVSANQPPVADDKTATSTPNTTPVQVPTLSGTDPDGTVASYTITTLPTAAQGTLLLNGVAVTAGQVLTPAEVSQLVFQPNPTFVGNATFNYTVTDNNGTADATPATVTLPVTAPPNQPPVADDKTATSTPNTTPVQVPTLSGTDPDGTVVSYTITTLPTLAQGTLSLNGAAVTAGQVLTPAQVSQLVFQPNANFVGNATFNYTVTDNNGAVDATPATVNLPVTAPAPANQPPVADDKTAPSTPNTTPVQVPPLTGSDPDGTVASFTITTPPTPDQGTLLLNGTPIQAGQVLTPAQVSQLVFQPNPNFVGNATFNYTVTDNNGTVDATPATVTLPVTAPANQPPVTDDKTAPSTPSGTPVQVPNLTGSDPDPGGTIVSFTITTVPNPTHGTLLLNGTPVQAGQVLNPTQGSQLIFQPNPGFTGTASFTYAATDNNGATDASPATVTLPVGQTANQPPIADDKTTAPTPNNTPVQVPTLTGSDPDGTIVSFTIQTLPDASQGTLLLNGAPVPAGQVLTPAQASQLVFRPNPNFTGNATFTYTTTDNTGLIDSTPATVTLPVIAANQPPIADNKTTAPTPNNVPVQVPTLTGSDPDGTIASFTISTLPDPAQGTLLLNGTPVPAGQVLTPTQASQLVFRPNPNFTGNATFTYTTTDNTGLIDSTPATVTLPVIAANQPPVADDKTATPTPNTTPVQVPTLTGSDPDGTIASFTIITLPNSAQGTLSLNGASVQAGQVLTPAQASQLVFQPNPSFTGNATFTYTTTDNLGTVDATPATVTMPVIANQPPVANNDNVGTNPATPVVINPFINDRDPDNNLNPSSLSIISNPTSGTVTVNPDATITYTPNPGFTNGIDSFVYQICDTKGLCDTATITVTVPTPTPLPPVANDDRASTNPNTPVIINVLGNDTDPNNNLNPTSVTTVSNPANGTVSVNPITGQITYTPNPGFTNGTDTFVYQVCDTTGLCDRATVTVTVPTSGINPPIATNDSTSTNPNTPVILNILANDSDPDGNLNPASLRILSNPANGTVTINPDGTVTYTPNPGFTIGVDTFVYEICDTTGLCTRATVVITVPLTIPKPPIAEDDFASTNPNTPVLINVTTNDRDPEGNLDPTTIQIVTPPTNGRVTIEPGTGQIIYYPNPGFTSGTDTVIYRICDTAGLCDTATVTIIVPVVGVNPPIANNVAVSTEPNSPVIINVLANANDPNGNLNPGSIRIVANPTNGTARINSITGQITYTPNPDFRTGIDTFSYEVCDTSGLCTTATVSVRVPRLTGNQTDLQVTQTSPTTPVQPGNNVTFTTQVTNEGPGIATAVILTNPLPANTTFVSATPSQGTCELTNNNVVCNLGDLNPGQTVTIPVVVTPTAPGTITNQVTIASPSDSTPTNNQANAIAQIVAGEPRLRLVKRITSVTRSGNVSLFNDLIDDPADQNDNAPGWSQLKPLGLITVTTSTPVRSGDTVEYTIYFLSDGTTAADNVRICDAIPTNTTFIPDAFEPGKGLQLNLAGAISALTNEQDGDIGRFFSALAPLPTGNPCLEPNNPNGTVFLNFNQIPNTAGNNFGFVRFRVRID